MNTASKIAKESTITFSGMIYGSINRYIYIALLARWVGIEYLGIYSLANAIMLIGEVIAKMGLETGVMRFVSQLEPQTERSKIQRIIQSSLKMTVIFSLGIAILLSGFSWFLVSLFKGTPILHIAIIVFAFTIPFNAFTLVSAFATQGFKLLKYKVFTTQFLNPTVLLLVMMISYWFISKELAIVVPIAATGVLGSITMFWILKYIFGVKLIGVLSTPFDRRLLAYSIPLMFVTILQTFMHWMDILMLGYFTHASVVGLYYPAVRTAGLLQALLISFISIYAPMISQSHGKGDFREMSRLYKLVSRWLITFSIPISLVFILYPMKVMLIFGPDYIDSASVLVLLTIATFVQTVLGAASPVLSMSGYTRIVFWNSLGAFILNLILNVILIPKYGIMGAAWATLISLTTIGIARVIEVRFILGLSLFSSHLYKSILAGIVTWLCLVSIHSFVMPYHTLVTLSMVFLCSILVYGFVLWLLKLEPEDKDFLSGLNILSNSLKKIIKN